MKNKIIGLAIAAALAAPAIATAAPTVYGHLQVEIGSVSNDGYGENNGTGKGQRVGTAGGESALKVTDNKRGRLGFKGSEDLGGKLKANYKLEWQVDTAGGNPNDGAREAWVGLSGGFGAFEFGRIKSSYKYTGGVKYDPFVTTYMEARNSGGMIGGDFGANGFWSNAASWKMKSGPHRIWINVGLDEGDGANGGALGGTTKVSTKDGKAATTGDLAATYLFNAGKWEAFVGYSADDAFDNTEGLTDNTYAIIKVGGKAKFGAHSIALQYEMLDADGIDTDATVLFLGYQLKMGKNILVAQFGQTDHDVDAIDTDYYALGIIHKFSKKTRVFAGYRVSDQTDDVAAGPTQANELSVISAGLRVDF